MTRSRPGRCPCVGEIGVAAVPSRPTFVRSVCTARNELRRGIDAFTRPSVNRARSGAGRAVAAVSGLDPVQRGQSARRAVKAAAKSLAAGVTLIRSLLAQCNTRAPRRKGAAAGGRPGRADALEKALMPARQALSRGRRVVARRPARSPDPPAFPDGSGSARARRSPKRCFVDDG